MKKTSTIKLFSEENIKIGTNLKFLRRKKGWNQPELGIKLGVSKTIISNWERDFSYPPPDAMFNLIELFRVNIHEFVYEDISKKFYTPYDNDEKGSSHELSKPKNTELPASDKSIEHYTLSEIYLMIKKLQRGYDEINAEMQKLKSTGNE